MKKARFLALALVVAVMMMGAGYAWWSESVEINNTVKTGELKVEFNKEWTNGGTWGSAPEYLLKPYFTGIGKKTMTARLEDLYPATGSGDGSAWSTMSVEIVNNGTVAATFDDAVVIPNASTDMKNYINVQAYLANPAGSDDGYHAVAGRDYKKSGTLNTLEDTIEELLADFTIEPGDKYIFRIAYQLDSSAPNRLERETATPKITLNWKQFNQD